MNISRKFTEFISHLKEFSQEKDIINGLDHFLNEKFPAISFTIFKHRVERRPYSIEIESEFSQKVLQQLYNISRDDFKHDGDFYFTENLKLRGIRNFRNHIRYVIVFTNLPPVDKKDVLDVINQFEFVFQFYSRIILNERKTLKNYSANLFSQINHDIGSFINLTKKQNLSDDELIQKTDYMEKLSRNVLLYLRDLDMVMDKYNWLDVINGIFEKIENTHNLTFKKEFIYSEKENILLDLELIDRAVSELIFNALEAQENKKDTIIIGIEKIAPVSLFIDHNWLKIEIRDNGPGIHHDFISQVKDPFFTTKKEKGHTGFGLAIAEKIINAHRGILSIENTENKGVCACIMLPLTENINQ